MKVTTAQCEAALRNKAGLISLAAEEAGLSRQAMHVRIKKSKHLQAVLRDIEEKTLDLAEGVIVEALGKKDKAMARWYAARKGKSRGFTLKHEVTGAGGAPLLDVAAMIEGMTDEQFATFDRLRRLMGTGLGAAGGPPPED